MASTGASTSQGNGVQAVPLSGVQPAVANENIAPNVGAAEEDLNGTSKIAPRKDWEKKTAAERLARRTKYLELANDRDPKTISLQQQAKAMAEPVIEMEDFILYVRTFNLTGANAQQQMVYNQNIAKAKAALRSITDRLDVLHVANRHGWDIAKRLIERRQTGEDKELQLAIDDVRKREAEKGKQERRDRQEAVAAAIPVTFAKETPFQNALQVQESQAAQPLLHILQRSLPSQEDQAGTQQRAGQRKVLRMRKIRPLYSGLSKEVRNEEARARYVKIM